MKNNFCFVVLFHLFLFSSLCYGMGEEIQIYFFDVGQGNCTLIKRPKAPPILVDAGSSTHSTNTPASIQKTRIITHIINSIPSHNAGFNYDLQVIVSHPDKDHINWIQEITDKKNYKKGQGLKINFLQGYAVDPTRNYM